jgi:hypothetical protein
MRGSESAVLISWESWKRRHDAGIMNFCGGSWYGVFVVNMTGIEGETEPSISFVEFEFNKVDWIFSARRSRQQSKTSIAK